MPLLFISRVITLQDLQTMCLSCMINNIDFRVAMTCLKKKIRPSCLIDTRVNLLKDYLKIKSIVSFKYFMLSSYLSYYFIFFFLFLKIDHIT